MDKRGKALKLLEEFKSWYMEDCQGNITSNDHMIIIVGLMRIAICGTESEVDSLIEGFEARNSQALMKKMSENIT